MSQRDRDEMAALAAAAATSGDGDVGGQKRKSPGSGCAAAQAVGGWLSRAKVNQAEAVAVKRRAGSEDSSGSGSIIRRACT